jgi:hypothetical protein
MKASKTTTAKSAYFSIRLGKLIIIMILLVLPLFKSVVGWSVGDTTIIVKQ